MRLGLDSTDRRTTVDATTDAPVASDTTPDRPAADSPAADGHISEGARPRDHGKPDPDVGKPDPDVGKPDPDVGKPDPDVGKPDPDVGKFDLLPDLVAPPDAGVVACPAGMAAFTDYCIDKTQGAKLTWVESVQRCADKGKRLCSKAEWLKACTSTGKGMSNMVGDYEWLFELTSSVIAKMRGSVACGDAASNAISSGSHTTRCCKARTQPAGMVDFGAFAIDPDESGATTWAEAVEVCAKSGKRLCTGSEWVKACFSTGKGLLNMVGSYEWIGELVNVTTASKVGASSCMSRSSVHIAATLASHCCY